MPTPGVTGRCGRTRHDGPGQRGRSRRRRRLAVRWCGQRRGVHDANVPAWGLRNTYETLRCAPTLLGGSGAGEPVRVRPERFLAVRLANVLASGGRLDAEDGVVLRRRGQHGGRWPLGLGGDSQRTWGRLMFGENAVARVQGESFWACWRRWSWVCTRVERWLWSWMGALSGEMCELERQKSTTGKVRDTSRPRY